MRQETLILIVGCYFLTFFITLCYLYPGLFETLVHCLPGTGVIWSRHGSRIWQRSIDYTAGTPTVLFNGNNNVFAVSIATFPAAYQAEAPAIPVLASRDGDTDQCPRNHGPCQPLHNNCCPNDKQCCGLGCCRSGSGCADGERGLCCPRPAVLCGDKCVRGDCCAGGTHACANEGETCCGRARGEDGGGTANNDKWHREMRCCKKGEYCHGGSECRAVRGEESRGAEEARGSVWAWVFVAFAAAF
ncbi:hypothetical protein B0T11DRAFT_294270 [Plectosphaerella cucumerina]|uniref:Uncharacterized protein n=1 Tax=Plectosphaerella cucumerina TaxID=40658 RepID=A0A8K0X9F5_9PEZI|nr:hypothetical protein B0T11DRAFT_294270 [Plectosphaerella cucumerina]